MTNNIHISTLQDEDIDNLVELCVLQPGKAQTITADYIRWQRDANPAGQAQVTLAKEASSGMIVGVIWFIPLQIKVGSEVVPGSQSLYALVHPDYRGRGLFTKLTTYGYESVRRDGAQFSYGFPNQNSYPLFIHRLGWSTIGKARLMLRPLKMSHLLSHRIGDGVPQKVIAAIGDLTYRGLFHPKPLRPVEKIISIQEVHADNPGLGEFWGRVKDKYPVMLVRDNEFLRWRYAKIPGREYQFLAATCQGRIAAYAVLRNVVIDDVRCGMLVDFLVEPKEIGQTAGEQLVQEVVNHFAEIEMELAGCLLLPGAQEIEVLRRQGFILSPGWLQPQPFPVILRAEHTHPGWGLIRDINSWFLTMGDFDAV